MRVMELSDDWGLDQLRPGMRPDPEPGPGQVVVRMEAASLNFRDTVMVERGYGRKSGELPLIPVSDGAGTVTAVGDGVSRVRVGDLVCPTFAQLWVSGPLKDEYWTGMLGGPQDGVLQEYMLLPETGVVRAPAGYEALQASTLPCAALTAWSALVTHGALAAGQVVLVQGAGGVSVFGLLFAKMLGAEVIVTSSSADRLDRLKALGADHAINYNDVPQWSRETAAITGGRGVDIVVEVGGAGTLDQSLRAVRTGGMVAMIGVLSGGAANLNLGQVVTRDVRLQGITIGNRDMLEAMIRAIDLNGLEPPIDDHIYDFDQVTDALRAMPKGEHFGKICVRF